MAILPNMVITGFDPQPYGKLLLDHLVPAISSSSYHHRGSLIHTVGYIQCVFINPFNPFMILPLAWPRHRSNYIYTYIIIYYIYVCVLYIYVIYIYVMKYFYIIFIYIYEEFGSIMTIHAYINEKICPGSLPPSRGRCPRLLGRPCIAARLLSSRLGRTSGHRPYDLKKP